MNSYFVTTIICSLIAMSYSLLVAQVNYRRVTSKMATLSTVQRRHHSFMHSVVRGRRSKLRLSNENNDAADFLRNQSLQQNPKSPLVSTLLQKTASRALRTLSTTTSGNWDDTGVDDKKAMNDEVQNVIDAAVVRSSSTLDDLGQQDEHISKPEPKHHQDKRTYLNNPCVTPTALAHTLWKSTIIPFHDTVIDATCGNGKDCLALTDMLFPDGQSATSDVHPHLIGIDIQSRAIANTQRSLLSALSDEIYYNHLTLLEQSHEHLLSVIESREDGKQQQVGLVCYNLGYLPGGQADDGNYRDVKTQTETTLNSIADAALLLRVGGLLSVMTYPGSNLEESLAVEHFVEGLAMLTTRDDGGWRGYLDNIPDYSCDEDGKSNDGGIRNIVRKSIERVAGVGSPRQTWRTFVHKPLGRPLSPILCTAHRIK